MSHSLHQAKIIQKSLRDWIDISQWRNLFAVTLTMKEVIVADDGYRSFFVRLDRYAAVQNMRHFLNVLNEKVFKSAFRRFGKQLTVIPVLEGGRDHRLHYHAAMDCPRDNLVPEFSDMIRQEWQRTQWGYREIDVKRADDGWIDYITKLRAKSDFSDSIDWKNFHKN